MIGQRHMIPSSDGYEMAMDFYIPQVTPEIDEHPRRRAIVIFPGGGYEYLSTREAEPIALMFCAAGFNAFVAFNRFAPHRFPTPLKDAGAAVAYVRAHADELGTDPDKIAIMGFSAGGHLAGSLGTRWHMAEYWQDMGLTPSDVRPNAMALCYPVVTGGEHAHRGSFINLTGTSDIETHKRYSLDGWVTPDCPPTFLWHTFADESVPVQNSLLMAQALAENKVRTELHVFPLGGHGSSLCAAQTSGARNPHHVNDYNAQWINLAIHFLENHM